MFLSSWIIVTAALTISKTVDKTNAASERPNLIYILADDLGWGDVSFHGYNEIPTPKIDRLANEGVILNSFYTHPVCTPSRAALMTGKYAMRFNLQRVLLSDDPRGLNLTTKILPQYLKDLGYSTHLVGKWHLGNSRNAMLPYNRGFDTFFGYYKGTTDYYNYTFYSFKPIEDPAKALPGYDLWERDRPAFEYNGSYATELFTKKAVEVIEQQKAPFYLQLSHLAPHFANAGSMSQAPNRYTEKFPWIKHRGRRTFAGVLAALDDSVGQIFEALRRTGKLDNTVIFFSSDNGGLGQEQNENLADKLDWPYGSNWPLRGTKGTLFEAGVRITAFVWSKLLNKSRCVSNELYHLTDILPTFYKLAGGKEPIPALDGFDIWESISDDTPSPREEVYLMTNSDAPSYAIRWKQYKLYLNYSIGPKQVPHNKRYKPFGYNPMYVKDTPATIKCNNNVSDEDFAASCNPNDAGCLFDIVQDPCEMVNLASQHPDIVADLTRKLLEMGRMYKARPAQNGDPRAYNMTRATGLTAVSFIPDDVPCTWDNFCNL